MSGFYSGYIHNFYNDEQDIIDDIFCQNIKALLKDIDHPAFIQEWKQNIDAATSEEN